MKSRTKVVQGILIIILIAAILAAPVAAMTVSGDATVDNSDQTTVTSNSVTIEKKVNVEMENNAQVKDATSNGPMGPATSNDGTITVSLNADITASGKTTGTGSAILNGSVVAQGSHDAGNTSAVINTTVSSTVFLNSGTKGSAEGKVFSSGTASATYNGTELESDVSGSSAACGKTQSASIGILNATGGIVSQSRFTPDNASAVAEIYSYIYGENKASGSASASGRANASADNGNITSGVTGETKASGSSSGYGGFSADSEILSFALDPVENYLVASTIDSGSSVWSDSGKYTATASSSASTSLDKQNTAHILAEPGFDPLQLDVNTTGGTKSDAAICGGTGQAGSEASISAFAGTPLPLYAMELGLGDMVSLVFWANPLVVDVSGLQSNASAFGSRTSASGSTLGEANAMATNEIDNVGITENLSSITRSQGSTQAKVNVKDCGVADAHSTITSIDLLGVTSGFLGLVVVNPIPGDATLPDIPEQSFDQNLGFTDSLLPDENLLQLDPISFDLPGMQVLEISLISQSSSAQSFSKGKVTADACANGQTNAEGLFSVSYRDEIGTNTTGSSSASGFVAGGSEAGAKCEDGDDPVSDSVILGLSAQGINLNQGLDATLIASASGAGGSSGKTWGTATGTANAAGGTSEIGLQNGPSSSSGTVRSSANANGGLGLSGAVIGSADFETLGTGTGDLVDVALIGTGAFASGTAGANAYANGQTEANGSIVYATPDYEVLNVSSDAFAIGEACSDVSTKNGVALAADVLLAGENSGAGISPNPGIGGGGIAGSTVSQVAFAQQFGKSGSAKATTNANGQAGTSSTFYFDLGPGSDDTRMYASGDGTTGATGKVSGSANAGCGDPLSASTIMAFTEFGGGIDESFAGSGEAYNAALIASLSASSGKSATTWGSANGSAVSDSHLEVNTTPADDSLYSVNSSSSADASVKTTASTTGKDGFALGVAAQGASSEVEATIDDIDTGSGHAITLDGALSLADGEGKATAFVNMEEQLCKDKKGKVKGTTLVPIEGREASALAQFTADINDDFVPDGNFTSSSVSGSHALTSAEAAKGGFGLSLAGEASGALTEVNATGGTIDQDVFSVIADLALAETDCSKETAKANAEAGGTTTALNYAEVPGWNGTQTSQAQGSVSANAVGGDKSKDPLAASLILAIGDNDVYPDPYNSEVPAMDTSDQTLIASLSVSNGTKGNAGANACGSADSSGVQNSLNYGGSGYNLSPTSSSSTDASVWSHAAGNNGFGLGIAGVGSSSAAHIDINHENVSDQDLMFSYASAQGFGKKATADAAAGYDAAHTATSESSVYDRDPQIPKATSTSSIAGTGKSLVQASDMNKAQALSFGWAGQNATIDWTVDTSEGSHADAMVLFGTEANATNDAKGTTAKADICQVNLAANATAAFADFSIPEENALVGVNDGFSYVFIDPDGGPTKNGFIDLDTKNTVGTYEASVTGVNGSYTYGRFVKASTMTDPNYGYTHGGSWANSDVGTPPSPFPPEDYILPLIPV